MPPDEKENLGVAVAALTSRVDAVQESLQKNNESTAGLREDVARLRGEINGTLPRIDRNVERLFGMLEEHEETARAYREKTEVHDHEIGILFKLDNGKASKAANEEAHTRLWFFLKVSLLAIATGAVGALIAKVYGF